MRGVLLGVGLAGLALGAAGAEVISRPEWASRPTAEVMARYYPAEALDKSVSGRVTVVCKVMATGRLEGCSAVSESPVGMGFGEAVVNLAMREFRMKPERPDGPAITGATVRIPVVMLAPTYDNRSIITEAVWDAAPTFEDMAAAWPASMADLPVGTAVLRCRTISTGELRNCTIAGQTPIGAPFGEAARTLMGKFRLKITPEEVRKYGGSDIAISFRFYNPTTPAGQAKKVEKPDWIVSVDPRKVVALYPAAAADAGIKEGVGVADCLVAADGKMTDCGMAREAPTDMGFGPAAVQVVGLMQMDPWTPEGRPVAGARVRVPIKFSLAPEAEEAPQ